jgi:hypothetical protein
VGAAHVKQTTAKYTGLSAAPRTVRLFTASVEMTFLLIFCDVIVQVEGGGGCLVALDIPP